MNRFCNRVGTVRISKAAPIGGELNGSGPQRPDGPAPGELMNDQQAIAAAAALNTLNATNAIKSSITNPNQVPVYRPIGGLGMPKVLVQPKMFGGQGLRPGMNSGMNQGMRPQFNNNMPVQPSASINSGHPSFPGMNLGVNPGMNPGMNSGMNQQMRPQFSNMPLQNNMQPGMRPQFRGTAPLIQNQVNVSQFNASIPKPNYSAFKNFGPTPKFSHF